MTKGNGLPCKKCGTSQWYTGGECVQCAKEKAQHRYRTNKESIKEQSHLRYITSPEAAKESVRRWRKANPDKVNERSRGRYKTNPDKMKENNRRWQKNNHESGAARQNRRRTRKTEAGGSYTAAEWKAITEHYGNKCLCCGRDDIKLTADHVIPVANGGTSNIDNIQPLCFPCNARKGTKTIDFRPGPGLGRWIQRKLFG